MLAAYVLSRVRTHAPGAPMFVLGLSANRDPGHPPPTQLDNKAAMNGAQALTVRTTGRGRIDEQANRRRNNRYSFAVQDAPPSACAGIVNDPMRPEFSSTTNTRSEVVPCFNFTTLSNGTPAAIMLL